MPSSDTALLPDRDAPADIDADRPAEGRSPVESGAETDRGRLLPLMQETIRLTAEVLKADFGGAAELLPNGKTLLTMLVATESGGQSVAAAPIEVPHDPAESIASYALSVRRTVVTPTLATESRFQDAQLNELGITSAMAVPLSHGDRMLGTLSVFRQQQHEFTPTDGQYLYTVGNMFVGLAAQLALPTVPGDVPRPDATASEGKELRTSPRRRYQYSQMIAPIQNGEMPSRKNFFHAECRDISKGGISFFLNEAPTFEELVVRLGQPGAVSHLTARIVRTYPTEHNGRTMYMIGCQFTGRVHL